MERSEPGRLNITVRISKQIKSYVTRLNLVGVLVLSHCEPISVIYPMLSCMGGSPHHLSLQSAFFILSFEKKSYPNAYDCST